MQVEFNSCMLYSMLSDLTSITLMTILANIYNIAVCFNKQSDWENKILILDPSLGTWPCSIRNSKKLDFVCIIVDVQCALVYCWKSGAT